tara:strand:- start:4583 stop:5659 length:1077 start_codon:yes stop_codon:yes gene_type:complete
MSAMKHLLTGLAILLVCGCASEEGRQWSSRSESVIEPGSPALQQPVASRIEVLDEAIRVSAVDLLMQASQSEDPLLRANAIEGLQPVGEQLDEVVRFGMTDENEGVRYIAVLSVGMQRLCSLSHLVRPMLDDASPSVRAAAMFSLERCGDEVDLSPLAGMVLGGDPTAKANAAFVLGELGNPSAIPLIRSGVGRRMGQVDPARVQAIDLVMAEAMVRLGDDSEREVIRAALFSPSERGELTALASQMLGELGDTMMIQNLQDLATGQGPRQPGIEIQLVASEALARLDPNRVPVEFVLQQVQHPAPGIRAQAASVLGTLDSARFGPQLSVLIRDQDPRVQVAAAAASLRDQSAPVVEQ